ncbi:uncharacterized protein PG986_007477 [Apiospora aurea]|uniref:DUF2423 domain-containing protein n=1 Tax=Apiospora aurea TaxID=335848 RepID=A0ABR1QCY7_9PEZI
MAKSSRASTIKANNQRLKRNVFGPVEAARLQRLSAKMREIAAQPKPTPRGRDEACRGDREATAAEQASETAPEAAAMEVDSAKPLSKRSERKRIEKRKKPSKIVFQKYSDRVNKKKR